MPKKTYCLKNIFGIKLIPLCKNRIAITKWEYENGHRITANTLGLNMLPAREILLTNEYIAKIDEDIYRITFNFRAIVKKYTVNSINTDNMSISFHLVTISIDKNNIPISDMNLDNRISSIIQKINSKLKPLMTDVRYINVDILNMIGLRADPYMEYFVKLVNNDTRNITGLKFPIVDIRLGIDIS